ncbi:hypothetical protein PV326_009207, partial [Microctonus aethiopoides]
HAAKLQNLYDTDLEASFGSKCVHFSKSIKCHNVKCTPLSMSKLLREENFQDTFSNVDIVTWELRHTENILADNGLRSNNENVFDDEGHEEQAENPKRKHCTRLKKSRASVYKDQLSITTVVWLTSGPHPGKYEAVISRSQGILESTKRDNANASLPTDFIIFNISSW